MKFKLVRKFNYLLVLIIGWFAIGQTAFAQMQSETYLIDTYVVGSEGGSFSSSTNYQTGLGSPNIEYVNPTESVDDEEDNGSGGGSSSGSRRRTEESVTATSTLTEPTNTIVAPGNSDNNPTSGVQPSSYGELQLVIPEETTKPLPGDCLLLDSTKAKTTDQNYLNTHATYYKLLTNGVEVRTDIPINAFTEVSEAEVCIKISVELLPNYQYPDPSYKATLYRNEVYLVGVYNSSGQQINYFNEPIILNFSGLSGLSINSGVYEYVPKERSWVKNNTATLESTAVSFLLNAPKTIGLFTSETGEPVMFLDKSNKETPNATNTKDIPTFNKVIIDPTLLIVAGLVILVLFILLIILRIISSRRQR